MTVSAEDRHNRVDDGFRRRQGRDYVGWAQLTLQRSLMRRTNQQHSDSS